MTLADQKGKIQRLLNYLNQSYDIKCNVEFFENSKIFTAYLSDTRTILMNLDDHTLEENCFILAHEFKHALQHIHKDPLLLADRKRAILEANILLCTQILFVFLIPAFLSPMTLPIFILSYLLLVNFLDSTRPNIQLKLERDADFFAQTLIGGGENIFLKADQKIENIRSKWKKIYPFNEIEEINNTHPSNVERYEACLKFPLKKEFLESIINNPEFDLKL